MKKRGFKSWVRHRIETQRKLTIAAAGGMAALGLLILLVQAGILYLLLAAAYNPTTGFLSILLLYGTISIHIWMQAGKELKDARHKAAWDGKRRTFSLARHNSWIWHWAFGSMDRDRSVIEWIAGIAMIVPKLFCAARFTWQQLGDYDDIDTDTTIRMMKLLFRREQRVTVQNFADELGNIDLVKAIRDLSIVDGVVFLTKEELACSLAPRMSEELDKWRGTGGGGVPEDTVFSA